MWSNVDPKIYFGIICLMACWLLYILFNTTGMYSMVKKAASMVIQQALSLILTVVFLFFKILNSIEIFIVLLIDVLTGKRTAINKVTALAICSLSLASYYTTFTGMKHLVNEWIAALITIGVQTFLLVASLQIGLSINLNKEEEDIKPIIKDIQFLILLISLVITVLLFVFIKDDNVKNLCYFGVVAFLVLLLIRTLTYFVICKSEKQFMLSILMILYFITLSFSSFFSYNSFMNKLYKEDVRYEDAFLKTKTELVESLNNLENGTIKQNYKESKDELEETLSNMQGKLDEDKEEYEKYKWKKEVYSVYWDEKKKLEDECEDSLKEFRSNSGNDFGSHSEKEASEIREHRDTAIEALKVRLGIKEEPKEISSEEKSKWEPYENYEQLVGNSTKDNSNIFILLQKEEWTSKDISNFEELIKSLSNLEKILDNTQSLTYDAAQILSYKQYRICYKTNYEKILNCHLLKDVSLETYNEKTEQIFEYAYNIIDSYPLIYGSESTYDRDKTESVVAIEKAFREASQGTSELEKNIKAFLGSKFLALICMIIAVLVDCLILFVGLLTPKPVKYFKGVKYDDEKEQVILENLFNKPIK